MQRRISVQFTKLFWVMVRKIWLFVLIMGVFVAAGIWQTTNRRSEQTAYSISGKLLILQQSGEETGELMDNAARIQPVYDSIEVLTSGVFLDRVCEALPFDMTAAGLKSCLKVEQVVSTRVVNVQITGESAEKVQNILTSFAENAKEYMAEIMPEVQVQVLETSQTATVQNVQNSASGLKTGVLMGVAGCVIAAFVLILLYLLNDSVRTREDAEDYLEAYVIGEFKEKKKR